MDSSPRGSLLGSEPDGRAAASLLSPGLVRLRNTLPQSSDFSLGEPLASSSRLGCARPLIVVVAAAVAIDRAALMGETHAFFLLLTTRPSHASYLVPGQIGAAKSFSEAQNAQAWPSLAGCHVMLLGNLAWSLPDQLEFPRGKSRDGPRRGRPERPPVDGKHEVSHPNSHQAHVAN
ncbi:hypothetical protein GGTG_01547 [Gaeumannomyces tritici R3-111a-1]|uniref:Uncharacterized protein n=1 Tax=Gaeumannomyces tritici (strain R3-111a-1) TaxID=644352 RepID=J3NJW5_GAET3|nr:hypothetical protein GGTG_01547 [Gaeumannomyces tritici R3-111a-1]EJT81569.1 hypothetical protein GGTG_01547 [Gaeumannomyces tritici R3-111a-1]